MNIKFRGTRTRTGCIVSVSVNDGPYHGLPLYLEWVNHSPTGFEWGYYGSGPSQLAYAILHAYFFQNQSEKEEEAKRHEIADEKAFDLYVLFKQEVIGKWVNVAKWEISHEDINVWLWAVRNR